MDEPRLKTYYFAYILGAILFTVTLSAAVAVQRYYSEMADTVDKLRGLSGSSVKVKRATQSVYDTLRRIKQEIPSTFLSSPVENLVFQVVDTIRGQVKNAEVVVDSPQDKGDEIVLPIVLKGSLDDYAEFLKMLQSLESLRFPFFSTFELAISCEEGKSASYELRGSIRTLKLPELPGRQSASRRS